MTSRFLCSASIAALAISPAFAEDTGTYDLGTIVLKGELQSRTLQDSPTSAAVETGEELERRGDGDVYDAIERMPNVVSSFGDKGFSIRGVDQRGAGGAGTGLLVSTQVDGVALPNNQATFFGPYSNWDLEQIEVLRGPQSTQQGRNALAGAVIVRSNDPTYLHEAKLHAEYGSRNHHRYALMANTPLIDGKLALRFSAEHSWNDGYVTNPTLGTDRYDAREMKTYRAKLLWDATEDVEVIFSYSHTDSSGGEDLVSDALFPPARVNFSNRPASEGSKHDIFGVRANWALNDVLTLESETSYYSQHYHRSEDTDHTPNDYIFLNRTGNSEVVEQDLRLRFDGGGVSGVAGLFYTNIDNTLPTAVTADVGFVLSGTPNGVIVTRVDEFPTTTENIALYGEADIAADGLLPGLTFTLGARYDYEEFAFANRTTYSIPVLPDVNVSGKTDYQAFLPKIGMTYDVSPDQSLSLTIQRGYRAGGARINLFDGSLNQYDPEYTTNYELAYRGTFFEGALRTAANLYYTEWRDQQVNVPGASGNPFDITTLNAGKSEMYGAELLVEGEPTARLNFFGSLGYAHTEFIRFVSGGTNYSGNRFPNAPEWTATFGGTYSWDNGVSLGMDVSYTGSSYSGPTNFANERNDARWLVNTQLTYESGGGWLTGVYVRNLFDEDYVTNRDVFVGGGAMARTGEPRTIGAYVSKSF